MFVICTAPQRKRATRVPQRVHFRLKILTAPQPERLDPPEVRREPIPPLQVRGSLSMSNICTTPTQSPQRVDFNAKTCRKARPRSRPTILCEPAQSKCISICYEVRLYVNSTDNAPVQSDGLNLTPAFYPYRENPFVATLFGEKSWPATQFCLEVQFQR